MEESPRSGGRPPKPIDWEKVDRCLEAGMSGVQTAAYIGVYKETLYHAVEREKKVGFTVYAAEKSAKGESMIGLKQFQQAMKGDRGMLIWLGKQRLGQKETKEIRGDGMMPLQIEVKNFGETIMPKPYSNEINQKV